jgi:hypothetical protein
MSFRAFGVLTASVYCFSSQLLASMPSETSAELERSASELNHHVAGYALIVAGSIIVASLLSPKTRFLRYGWPLLLIGLGLFLAVWSDAEIWPRGPLPWTWLIEHDAEARQHKIYAAILLTLGTISFLRIRGILVARWHRWAFPMVAAFGAMLLMMHAHGGTSGLPEGWSPSQPLPLAASMVETPEKISPEMRTHAHGDHEHDMHDAAKTPTEPQHHSEHTMTPAMLKIQRQHLWMTIVGIVFAVSKFAADSPNFKARFLQFAWPTAMACLGVLLVLYRE